jgi:outer membrane biosynthesis protein TonB
MRRAITGSVVSIHLALVAWMLCAPAFQFALPKPKLVVRMVAPSQPPQVKVSSQPAPAPLAAVVEEEKVVEQPAPQKVEKVAPAAPPVAKPKAVAKAKAAPAVKPKPKAKSVVTPPPAANVPHQLLQQLEESLAKIESSPAKSQRKKALHTLPTITLATSEEQIGDTGFQESIAAYLHQALSLPEHGEVKIELTLRSNGTVAKVIVLRSESEKNKKYLETNLPALQFPVLDGMFSNKKQQTFILTFCSEI